MIYEQAFERYNFGYASAIAFVLLLITALLTAASWRFNGVESAKPKGKKGRRKARAAVIEGTAVEKGAIAG